MGHGRKTGRVTMHFSERRTRLVYSCGMVFRNSSPQRYSVSLRSFHPHQSQEHSTTTAARHIFDELPLLLHILGARGRRDVLNDSMDAIKSRAAYFSCFSPMSRSAFEFSIVSLYQQYPYPLRYAQSPRDSDRDAALSCCRCHFARLFAEFHGAGSSFTSYYLTPNLPIHPI